MRESTGRHSSRLGRAALGAALTLTLAGGLTTAAQAQTTTPPDLVPLLAGFNAFWQSSGTNNLQGTVKDPATLAHNDELATWVNNNATPAQQFRAMQDSEYDNGGAYDQSITISDSLGSILGPAYVKGRQSGALPLTSALINSQNGTTGAFVSTGTAKSTYSYPRPYLTVDPSAPLPAGWDAGCNPAQINGASLAANRAGKAYATAGTLNMEQVANVTDTTHQFSPNDVALSAGYGTTGICTGGSFPSGHTTTAYQAGITLATLLPELAPEILARASEAGNNRIVLGVHYPLDIVGGRIDGEVALAARWSDDAFRTGSLEPARKELVTYLTQACGTTTIAACVTKEQPYQDDPYGGKAMPGGTAQVVSDRASALSVYQERLTYGFSPVGSTTLAASVPTGAENLLLTAFPTLNATQRGAILAQTELKSGFALDGTGTAAGAWQRLDLAAAMSATVQLKTGGAVKVTKTGGKAAVVKAKPKPKPKKQKHPKHKG